MYCGRCQEDYFGGSLCPVCGGRMRRGKISYSRFGEPLNHYVSREGRKRAASGGKEAGVAEGLIVRLLHKLVDSIVFCALFSLLYRVGSFGVRVADSLMQTGGDIRPGIRLGMYLRRPIDGVDILAWALIVLLVFKFRHNPR